MILPLLIALSVSATAEPIRVGEYGSLTGSEATFGQTSHRGVMLAFDEANARGGVLGRTIEVITYDDRGMSQEAGTAVSRLINDDHVVAVLGEVASSLSVAGARVAQQYGVPMITPSSAASNVTRVGDMISRVCFPDVFQAYAAARFLRENLHVSRVAIVYDQGQTYSKGLADIFARDFVAMGGTLTTTQAYTGGDQDYSAQLVNVRDSEPQAVYAPGYYTDVGNLLLQARKLGFDAPFVGGDGWDSPELANIAGDAVNGSYFVSQYANEDERPETQAFVAAWRKAYPGTDPDGLAALGYDAARVLLAAMERAPSLAPKELAAAIASTKDFPGVTGAITMDAERNPIKAAVMIGFVDRAMRYSGTVQPRSEAEKYVVAESAEAAATSAKVTQSSKLARTLTDAIVVGSLYALIALGYTMVYGVLSLINFAHADIFMTGAWVSLTAAGALGFADNAPWWGVLIVLASAMAVCGAMAFVIERFAYRPLRGAPRLNVLITAIGVSLLIQNLAQLPRIFGTQPKRMPELIAHVDIIVVAVAVTLMLVLQFIVFKTKLGRAMRAVAYDRRTAALMGINVDTVIALTFVAGAMLAAGAGLLFALKYPGLNQPAHATWVLLGLKAFVAAVVGGIGNVRGAMAGGLLIGVVELFGAAYLSPHLRDVYVFALLIVVLLVKPSGLLSRATVEKV